MLISPPFKRSSGGCDIMSRKNFYFRLEIEDTDHYPNKRSNKTRTQTVVTSVQFGAIRSSERDRKLKS